MAQIYNEQVNWKPVQEQAIAEPTRQDYLGTAFQNLGNAMEKFGEYKAQIDDVKAAANLNEVERNAYDKLTKARDTDGTYNEAYNEYYSSVTSALNSLDQETKNRLLRSDPDYLGKLEYKGKAQQFKMQQEFALNDAKIGAQSIARDVMEGRLSSEEGKNALNNLTSKIANDVVVSEITKGYEDTIDIGQIDNRIRQLDFSGARTALSNSRLGWDEYSRMLDRINTVQQKYDEEVEKKKQEAIKSAEEKEGKEQDLFKKNIQEGFVSQVLSSQTPRATAMYVMDLLSSEDDIVPIKTPSGTVLGTAKGIRNHLGAEEYKTLMSSIMEAATTREKQLSFMGKVTEYDVKSDQLYGLGKELSESISNGDNRTILVNMAKTQRAIDSGVFSDVDTERRKEIVRAVDAYNAAATKVIDSDAITVDEKAFGSDWVGDDTVAQRSIIKPVVGWGADALNWVFDKIAMPSQITVAKTQVTPQNVGENQMSVTSSTRGSGLVDDKVKTKITKSIIEQASKDLGINDKTAGSVLVGAAYLLSANKDKGLRYINVNNNFDDTVLAKKFIMTLGENNNLLDAPISTPEGKKVAAELVDALINNLNANIPVEKKDGVMSNAGRQMFVNGIMNVLDSDYYQDVKVNPVTLNTNTKAERTTLADFVKSYTWSEKDINKVTERDK